MVRVSAHRTEAVATSFLHSVEVLGISVLRDQPGAHPMPASSLTQLPPLLSGALRAFLIGAPRIPAYPTTDVPSPLAKLLGVTLCGLQLFLYCCSAVGGPTLWALAQWYGRDDPLRGSWLLSLVLEGWCVIGMVLGILILLISRRWALPSGVEWGWMGIRLGLVVFLVLFGSYVGGRVGARSHYQSHDRRMPVNSCAALLAASGPRPSRPSWPSPRMISRFGRGIASPAKTGSFSPTAARTVRRGQTGSTMS